MVQFTPCILFETKQIMEYRTLISQFAAQLGVTDFALDDENVARLQADDMTLAFMEVPERNALLTWCEVATPPPEKLEQLYRLLLEASFMGRATQGAAFSLDRDTVYLHRVDPLVNLDANSLSEIVEDFLDLVEHWRGVIAAFRADDSDSSADLPAPDLGSSGFLRA